MKYRAGIESATKTIKEIGNSLKFLDVHAMVKNILTKNITLSLLGNLLVKSSPWLFKNILSLTNSALLYLVSKYGIKVKDKTKVIKPKILEKFVTCSLRKQQKLTTNQNIKFQKLSLFSRTFIQFIINFIFNVYKIKVSRVLYLRKKIIGIAKVLIIALVGFLHGIAFAQDLPKLISLVEKEYNIPNGLLKAIAEVESELNPYSVNVNGSPFIAKSKDHASKIISSYLNKGYTNIDVGVMQINMRFHGKHFISIEEMLVPKTNIKYAAKLLTELYLKYGNWQKAVRFYHSAKPHYHNQYSRKVMLSWLHSSHSQ